MPEKSKPDGISKQQPCDRSSGEVLRSGVASAEWCRASQAKERALGRQQKSKPWIMQGPRGSGRARARLEGEQDFCFLEGDRGNRRVAGKEQQGQRVPQDSAGCVMA